MGGESGFEVVYLQTSEHYLQKLITTHVSAPQAMRSTHYAMRTGAMDSAFIEMPWLEESIRLDQDDSFTLQVGPSNWEGLDLSYYLKKVPQHGRIEGVPPIITYHPEPGFHGLDSLTYEADNGEERWPIAEIYFLVGTQDASPPEPDTAAKPTLTNVAPLEFQVKADQSLEFTLEDLMASNDSNFQWIRSPLKGSLMMDGNIFLYTPFANSRGRDTIEIEFWTAPDLRKRQLVSFSISHENKAPIFTKKNMVTKEDTLLFFDVLAVDPDHDLLVYEWLTPPQHGQVFAEAMRPQDIPYPSLLKDKPDRRFFYPEWMRYLPIADYSGPDRFHFAIHDGHSDPVEAWIEFEVLAINDPPRAAQLHFQTNEDKPQRIDLNFWDPESDSFQVSLVQSPLHGAVTLSEDFLIYNPDPHYFGADVFQIHVTDARLAQATIPMTVDVLPINDAPVGISEYWQVVEDKPLSLRLRAWDDDQDFLQFRLLQAPEHGRLMGEYPRVIYQPDLDYFGFDRALFVVSDGLLDSKPFQLDFSVYPVKDSPRAISRQWVLDEDNRLDITLDAEDPDGFTNQSNLLFTLLESPRFGQLAGEGAQYQYTPDKDFFGEDSFSFLVSDGEFQSLPAQVRLTVRPVNDPPVAKSLYFSTRPDLSVSIQLQGQDVDSNGLSYEILKSPSLGQLSGDGANWNYQSSVAYAHLDEWTYRVVDEQGSYSEAAAVWIAVEPQDNGIHAESFDLRIYEDQTASITGQTDFQGSSDLLQYEILKYPRYGQLTREGPIFTYTPYADYHGPDDFQYLVRGPGDMISFGKVSLEIIPVNDPPEPKQQSFEVASGESIRFSLEAEDVDATGELFYRIVDGPVHGLLSGQPPLLTYTAKEGFAGGDTMTFSVSDSDGASGTAPIQFLILQPSSIFAGQSQDVSLLEDELIELQLTSNRFGPDVSYRVTQLPLHGRLEGNVPNISYVPSPHFFGSDMIEFEAYYMDEVSTSGQVLISILPVNDAPTASNIELDHIQGRQLDVYLRGADADGDALQYRIITPPLHGELYGDGPYLRYQPTENYAGVDVFSYVVSDGDQDSTAAQVSITVHPLGNVPIAEGMSLETMENEALELLLAAEFSQNEPLTYTLTQLPQLGELIGFAPNLTYRPFSQRYGQDSFRFRVTARNGMSTEASVFIHIHEVNDAPTVEDIDITIQRFEQVTIPVKGFDPEGKPLEFRWVTQPAHGLWQVQDGMLYLDHPGGSEELIEASFQLNDGELLSDPATLTIRILPSRFQAAFSSATIQESGEPTQLMLTRQSHWQKDIEFFLASNGDQRIELPASVVLPAGQEFVSLSVPAVDDRLAYGDAPVDVLVQSLGFEPVSLLLNVQDDDPPALSLTTPADWVTENGLPIPLHISINTPNVADRILVQLSMDAPMGVQFPEAVLLPANTLQTTFQISVADNALADGDRTLRLFAKARGLETNLPLLVLDDDVSHQLSVQDGPIAGASVFFDLDGDRQNDADEPVSFTDSMGHFLMDLPVHQFDLNADGKVNGRDGVFVASGGVDITSGQPFQGMLLAPASAQVLTPLTTLVSKLMDRNASLSELDAMHKVQSSLGIAGDIDILAFDMYQEAAKGNPRALEVIEPASQIQDTLLQSGSYLRASLGGQESMWMDEVSSEIVDKMDRGESLELDDPRQIAAVMAPSLEFTDGIQEEEKLHMVAETIALGNAIKQTIAHSNADAGSKLNKLLQSQAFVQSVVAMDMFQLAKGNLDKDLFQSKYAPEPYELKIADQTIGSIVVSQTSSGIFEFDKSLCSVSESGAAIDPLRIVRRGGALGKVALQLIPQSLSAKISEDLAADPITIIFESYQLSQEIDLSLLLIDDEHEEGVETFALSLHILDGELSDAKTGRLSEASVEIIDNDVTGNFRFNKPEDTLDESLASKRVWHIERVGGVKGEFTLSLNVVPSGSECREGSDYVILSRKIHFDEGESIKPVPIRILDDDQVEGNEWIHLEITVLSETPELPHETLISGGDLIITLLNDDTDQAPVITMPDRLDIEEDSKVDVILFHVEDDRTPQAELILEVVSSNQDLIADADILVRPLGGTGEWALELKTQSNAHGSADIEIKVSDGLNAQTHVLTLHVSPENDLPIIRDLPSSIEVGVIPVITAVHVEDQETPGNELLAYVSGDIPGHTLNDVIQLERSGNQITMKVIPTEGLRGTFPCRFYVVDAEGLGYGQQFAVTFNPTPQVGGGAVLRIEYLSTGSIQLTWEGEYGLWKSLDLISGFTLINGASSPHVESINQAAFYLLRVSESP